MSLYRTNDRKLRQKLWGPHAYFTDDYGREEAIERLTKDYRNLIPKAFWHKCSILEFENYVVWKYVP